MKRILKTFLIAISSLITATTLSACSLFGKKENKGDGSVLVIESASFTNTYTTITFDFTTDKNAIYYKATFVGNETYSLPRVEPSVKYNISNFLDGEYRVFLTAIANLTHTNSDPFLLGVMNKTKTQKSADDIVISANITENFGINVTVFCNENERNSLNVEILRNDQSFLVKRNIAPNSSFSTDNELPVGEYKISAFYNETDDFFASEKVFYNGSLSIGKRKLQLENFNVDYSKSKIRLSWNENPNTSSNKKLTITYNGVSATYTNTYKGQNIQRSMEINAADYGEGEIFFSLQLIPRDEETYFSSDILQSSATIEKYKISSAPDFNVEYGTTSGDVTIDFPNYTSGGVYHLSISYKSGLIQQGETVFSYEEDVSKFPIVFERANQDWANVEYNVSLYRKASTSLEIDSDVTTRSVTVSTITITPNVHFFEYMDDSDSQRIIVYAEEPSWLNEKWWGTDKFKYRVTFYTQDAILKTVEMNEISDEMFVINSVYAPELRHYLIVGLNTDLDHGFRIEKVTMSYDGGTNSNQPTNTNLGHSFDAFKGGNNGSPVMINTVRFILEVYCEFPYTQLETEIWYSLPNEPVTFIKSQPYFSGEYYACGLNEWEEHMHYGQNLHNQTITFGFSVTLKYAGYTQTLTTSKAITL